MFADIFALVYTCIIFVVQACTVVAIVHALYSSFYACMYKSYRTAYTFAVIRTCARGITHAFTVATVLACIQSIVHVSETQRHRRSHAQTPIYFSLCIEIYIKTQNTRTVWTGVRTETTKHKRWQTEANRDTL